MGVTGAGKSTFIELVTGAGVRVGHGLESCKIPICHPQTSLFPNLIILGTANVEDFCFMYNEEIRVHLIGK